MAFPSSISTVLVSSQMAEPEQERCIAVLPSPVILISLLFSIYSYNVHCTDSLLNACKVITVDM